MNQSRGLYKRGLPRLSTRGDAFDQRLESRGETRQAASVQAAECSELIPNIVI
jgi:hypothetical protein